MQDQRLTLSPRKITHFAEIRTSTFNQEMKKFEKAVAVAKALARLGDTMVA